MSTDPDVIRSEIEQTREELSSDVDALAYKASPGRMVQERTDRVRGVFRGAREKVMGVADATGDKASEAASAVSDAASSVAGTASEAPRRVGRAAQGNPIAAGLIVFGAAWLVSSLLPRSEPEQQAAGQVRATVEEHADELKQAAGDAARSVQDSMREPVQQATESVKSTAAEAVQTVKEDGRSAAHQVSAEARS
jgi:hypothetical protein